MATIFTGLLLETDAEIAARLAEQIAMPVSAGLEVPETLFDVPPEWNRIENQSQTNTCATNAGTSVMEVVWYQATGELLQLSRLYLYAKAGVYCGISTDRGRTLGSVIKAGQLDGACLEAIMPFTVPVTTRVPAGADQDAAQRKIAHTVDVRTGGYNAVRTLIGQNMGAVLMATYWPIQYVDGYIVERYKPTGNGGHARAWLFLASKLDSQGRPYVWCANSHSTSAQRGGYELWSPTAVEECLRGDPWGITGITAMTTPKPHVVDWAGVNNPFAA